MSRHARGQPGTVTTCRPDGEVSCLLKREWATPADYVFDVVDGVLYELMLELRQSDKTWLLLQQTPQARLLNDDTATDKPRITITAVSD